MAAATALAVDDAQIASADAAAAAVDDRTTAPEPPDKPAAPPQSPATTAADESAESGASTLEADASINNSSNNSNTEEDAASTKPTTDDVPALAGTAKATELAQPTVAEATVQALWEQKDELGNALTIPRCSHLCRFNAKVTPANQKCLEPTCDLHNVAVCATCSDDFHAVGDMRKHRQTMISTCPQCQLEPSHFYCLNCDLIFCAPCFRVIHEPSKVQVHKASIIEGASVSVLSATKHARAAQSRIPELVAAATAKATSVPSQAPQAEKPENGKASIVVPSSVERAPVAAAASTCTQLTDVEVPATAGLQDASVSPTSLSHLTKAELQKETGLRYASASTTVGDKRKRNPADLLDVIMIDSDSETDDRTVADGAQVPRRNNHVGALRNPNYRSAPAAGVPPLAPSYTPTTQQQRLPTNTSSSFSRIPALSQPPLQVAAASQSLAIEPFNRGGRSRYVPMSPGMQNLGIHQVVSSDAYDTESSSGINGSNGLDASTPIPSGIVEETAAPFVAPTPLVPPVAAPPYQHATDGWGANSTWSSPMGMYHGSASNDFTTDPGSAPGIPFANGTPTSVAARPAGSSTLITTAADWTANPLEDVLYNRYHQINLYTVNLEQHITRLNARIVQMSAENLATAQQMTLTLRQQQGLLQKAQLNRTSALIALIVQSSSIVSKIGHLCAETLSDIPQVLISSHRRCLELSQQIAMYASNIAALHQQMAVVLDSSGGMDQDTFHQNVSSINQALQANEQAIQSRKEERENEIVRIVQYSSTVRKNLKRTFYSQKQPMTPSYQRQQQGYQHHPPTNSYYQ